MKKDLKDLLKLVKVFQNDEYVGDGLGECLKENFEEFDKRTQEFILKYINDDEEFIDNVIEYIEEDLDM